MNVGCIPSKALLAAAEARHVGDSARFPGIVTSAAPTDLAALIGGALDRLAPSEEPEVSEVITGVLKDEGVDGTMAEAELECTCRVLPLAYVPRAIFSRDTRGVVKIVAEVGTGRVVGIHMAAANAGDAILAATYALEAGMTVDQLATTWAPYLTMAEGIKLAAQSFRTDVAKLSCCGA